MHNRRQMNPTNARAVDWVSTSIVEWMRQKVVASGGKASDVPDMVPARFLRANEVRQLTGMSTPTLYRWMASGQFPRPTRLDNSPTSRVA